MQLMIYLISQGFFGLDFFKFSGPALTNKSEKNSIWGNIRRCSKWWGTTQSHFWYCKLRLFCFLHFWWPIQRLQGQKNADFVFWKLFFDQISSCLLYPGSEKYGNSSHWSTESSPMALCTKDLLPGYYTIFKWRCKLSIRYILVFFESGGDQ